MYMYMYLNFKKNDQIYDALNRIPWYYATRLEQRNLICLLHRMQNGMRLTIGPLSELNYEMATYVRLYVHHPLSLFSNQFIVSYNLVDDS